MTATVHYLTPKPQPIGHFIRIGSNGHHQFETLHSSGRLPVDRVVADAASFSAQSALLGSLLNAGTEITLDTRIAELSEPGSYVSSAQWIRSVDRARPMTPRDFGGEGCRRIALEVARLAVTNGVHTVLAPSHFIKNALSIWWPIDQQLCAELRRALDETGGGNIEIDYSLTTAYGTLLQSEQRRAFLTRLRDLSFENLWLRISDFGSDATPASVRRYISSMADFHA